MLLSCFGKNLFVVLEFLPTLKAENFLYSVFSTILDRKSPVFVKKKKSTLKQFHLWAVLLQEYFQTWDL